ncbi:hypothetical protein ANCCAN_28209 [Ancylostoma caninum]|uniref:Serpentine receptor class gamma n=1 Tax=Ancylostoma caninum TaxID=29170 RepID=A0A368F1V5_ANCCA|nr:hypothetical protein ANCCAN_28209 [Ancylostoma caninum]
MHFAFVQSYMTFFISLNRMAFIVRPRMEERIWKVVAPTCAAIACLSPFAATYPYLTNRASWIFVPKLNSFFVTSNADIRSIWKVLFIFLCVLLSLSSTVNIISVVTLCRRKRMRSNHTERSMLILALLNFLIECSYFVIVVSCSARTSFKCSCFEGVSQDFEGRW